MRRESPSHINKLKRRPLAGPSFGFMLRYVTEPTTQSHTGSDVVALYQYDSLNISHARTRKKRNFDLFRSAKSDAAHMALLIALQSVARMLAYL